MSRQTAITDSYMQGFRTSNHEQILQCLTDDVVWCIHGHRTTHGKVEFDDEIENDAFEGSPDLTIDRVLEDGNVVIPPAKAEAPTARTAHSDSPTTTSSPSAVTGSRGSTHML